MKDQISKRDWETISAYIDGQLSMRKQSRFEVRLSQEPHLQQALEEIRKTRQILRNTPFLRVPRNFMLTPQMAGQQQRLPRLSPVFGWASAVASFLLVLVLVGDIFSVGGAIPVAVNTASQQVDQAASSEFGIAQESVDTETFGESAALKGEAAGGYSRAAEPESSEGEELPEVASAPEMEAAAAETAAVEESVPEPTKDVEIIVSGSTADDVVETPEESLNVAPAAEGTAVTFMSPSETAETRQIEVQPETGADTPVDDESVVAAFTLTATTTLMAESANEQAIAESPQEEATQPPAEEAMPMAPQAQPSASTSDLAPMMEESQVDTIDEAVPVEEKPDDFLLGAEVILAVLALGLGMAWLYMRRQGG